MNDELILLERIALPDLADELQCHKQTLFKIAKRLGITFIKRRDPDRRNQLVATVTNEDALRIRAELLLRTRIGDVQNGDGELLVADTGVFYLIQLEPSHDPGRIKLGFTTDIDGRLRKHRCSAPFAQSLKTWPCRRHWERAAIDCVTFGLEQLHTEIFRAGSIEEVATRGDSFFAIMPIVRIEADDSCSTEE